jgi:hypothetical protein
MGRLAAAVLAAGVALGQTSYYRHVIFDDSRSSGPYFFSEGTVVAPSALELEGDRLPVETQIFRTPPNALRMRWTSAPGGSWEAILRVEPLRNRPLTFVGDALYFWCYSPKGVPAGSLPTIRLSDRDGGFSEPVALETQMESVPAGKWVQVVLPLRLFTSISFHPFEPHRLAEIHFTQSGADGAERTLIVDDVSIDDVELPSGGPPAPPGPLQAQGYERHIDLQWAQSPHGRVRTYTIYRSFDGSKFEPVGIQTPGLDRYSDFLGVTGRKAYYRVTASDSAGRESAPTPVAEGETRAMTDDELLDMVEEASIRYYWEGANAESGMTLENIPGDDDIVATGASGFGILAMLVGVHRGVIPRREAAARMLRIADFLERAGRFHGAWPHFIDGRTGKAMPVFGMYDDGGDLVETAFLTQGLLAARQFFDGRSRTERRIREKITELWEGIDWNWYRQSADGDFLFWHWSPDYTWKIHHRLIGWNETMITYLLAMASPTHPVPVSMYYSGWASQAEVAVRYRNGGPGSVDGDHYVNGHSYYGIRLAIGARHGGPLFFTHYSFLGMDPHQLQDKYTNYFVNNQAIARINLAYCVRNPKRFPEYGKQCWGLTASDGPNGYSANEPESWGDDGTIAPTGALASMPYMPEASMEALKYYYRVLGDRLWGIYGFRDAFNLKENWWARIYMGLNQAPQAVMIENYRSGFVWKLFMANPEIREMLKRAGLEAGRRREVRR